MKKSIRRILSLVMALTLICACGVMAFAAESPEAMETASAMSSDGAKALAAGIAIAISSAAGAIGMGMAIAKALESIARQPEAEGQIRTTLMLGLVFVETAIIYALVVCILIIFVL